MFWEGSLTECEARSREIEQINRALRMHKDCIQEVMRAESEEELLESVKRVMVEVGGYRRVLSLSSKSCLQFQFEEHCPCGVLCGVLRGVLETGKGVEVKGTEEECSCCSLYPDPKDRCRLLAVPIKVKGECEYILAACGDAESGEFVSEEIALMEELAGDLSFGIEVLRLREERKKAMESLRYASFHDPLTGLYNRAFFMEELHRLDVERQLPLSFIFADVDGLKLVNDAFGHIEGDKLLTSFAKALKGCVRQEDIAARLGGDEFAVILPKTDYETAQEIACRIDGVLKNLPVGPIAVSASIGVATKSDPSEEVEAVFSEAERRMYRVKLTSSPRLKRNVLNFLYGWRRSAAGYEREETMSLLGLSQKLGAAMELSNADLERLYFLALFHDIGFVALPDGLINEDVEKLSGERFKQYAEHVEIGYRIALATPELSSIADEILLHHEQWDGSGFPRGLKGEEIPLLVRVLAPVYAYCNLIFKKRLPQEKAILAVLAEGGKRFDPRAAEALVDVLSVSAQGSAAT